ncbi:MAG: hypothetical protein R3E65_09670 [Steroidobacteraceae bacterium]
MHALKSLLIATLFALAFASATPASAQIRVLEQSYEVSPGQIVLPSRRRGPGAAKWFDLRARDDRDQREHGATVAYSESVPAGVRDLPAREHPTVQVTAMTTMRGDLVTRLRRRRRPTRASAR